MFWFASIWVLFGQTVFFFDLQSKIALFSEVPTLVNFLVSVIGAFRLGRFSQWISIVRDRLLWPTSLHANTSRDSIHSSHSMTRFDARFFCQCSLLLVVERIFLNPYGIGRMP